MTPEMTVDDVFNSSDAVLVRFLQKARNATGSLEDLNIHGWEKLPQAKRELLGEKLMTAMKQLTAAPLDTTELTARLIAVAAETDTPPRPPRRRSPTLSPDPNEAEDFESACYEELIAVGGRPPFPLGLLKEVLNDPASYDDLVQPWAQGLESTLRDNTQSIARELDRWRRFRRWQLDNRGNAPDAGFPDYLEAKRRDFKAMKVVDGYTNTPEFERCTHGEWERQGWDYQGFPSFSTYAKETKRRLARHGFTQPLQLNDDPKQQDQWTTWVEYLGFECWWLDRFTSSVERLQPQYDKVREMLKAAKGLKTAESKRDRPIAFVQRHDGSYRTQRLGRTMDGIGSNEATAEFMRKTKRKIDQYRAAQARKQRQSSKVQWILKQVGEIEAVQTVPPSGERPTLAKAAKRRRQEDDDALPNQT